MVDGTIGESMSEGSRTAEELAVLRATSARLVEPFARVNADLKMRLEAVGAAVQAQNERLSQMGAAFARPSFDWSSFTERFTAVARPILESFGGIILANRIEHSGWLPHRTLPDAEILAAIEHLDDLSAAIDRHYREKWPAVRAIFEERLATYDIDPTGEAQASFREALACHEAGLYRAVSRTLFPVVDALGHRHVPKQEQPKAPKIKGQKGPAKQPKKSSHPLPASILEEWPVSVLMVEGISSLVLFTSLDSHLYGFAFAEQLEALRKSPVPNRHAALHGLIPYETFQNSVNALIQVDYIFGVLDAWVRHQATEGVPA